LGGAAIAAVLLAGVAAVDPQDLGGDVLYSLNYRTNYLFDLTGGDDFVDPSLIIQDNRRDVWGYYLGRFVDSPLRGIGLGTGWGTLGLQEPHNLVIELLGETGLLGLAGFLLLAITVARNGGGTVGGTALLVALVPSMTQTVLFEPSLWMAAGLWLAGRVPRPVEPEVEMVQGVKS
jgi:O-antigen ligase